MEGILENKLICRICLRVLDPSSQSFGYIEDETGTLKEMLFCCIPELVSLSKMKRLPKFVI